MDWQEKDIDGVVLKPIARYADSRGWLSEVFRNDELAADNIPAMGYISMTLPGVARGPHEHVEQTDVFAFLGPGNFQLKMWDHREGSPTCGCFASAVVGEDNPSIAIVPPGVVHGYRNVSDGDGLVLNFPNRLYAGEGKREPVDEIRHEDDPVGRFSMD